MKLEVAGPDESREAPVDREELVVLHKPQSMIAEQYRQLRNSIQVLNPDGASRTLGVTSSVRGEGKSVATLNLALAMCEVPGARIVLVDADMRGPSLEDYLDVPRRQGLSELLRGTLPLDLAVRRTSIDGLDVIGAGTPPRNPSEVLGQDRIKSVLHALKRRYDYVLIDTPPSLSLTDASIVCGVCDGIIVVVRLGSTPRHMVEETLALLENQGGNVLGTCLTGGSERDRVYQAY